MRGDILLIGYTNEQSIHIVSELSSEGSVQIYCPRMIVMQDGQRIIPAVWYGRKSSPRLRVEGLRLDQVIIADDSRMNILDKVFPLLPGLYAACGNSDIPVEFRISILNIDTWNSEFIERWQGIEILIPPGHNLY